MQAHFHTSDLDPGTFTSEISVSGYFLDGSEFRVPECRRRQCATAITAHVETLINVELIEIGSLWTSPTGYRAADLSAS